MAKAGELVARLGIRPRGDVKNARSLRLPNGSRIVGLPGTEGTIRGFSAAALVVIDEAARAPDSLHKAPRPMLAVSGGELWLLSTPRGKTGFFYDVWAHGGDEWERVMVRATDCARIASEFLEEERRELGEAWFLQEYMCEFVDSGVHMFDAELVERAMGDVESLSFKL
ncbi:MAG TPA: terminase family protein [Bryobacteraceae bacterium]|nr:terminase family protein [Bryobacteraceae bacterium]